MELIWEIKPYVGMGQLEFGMTKEKTRALLNAEFVSFKKTSSQVNLTDDYRILNFHLYFDNNDELNFIEAFRKCDVMYEGMRFLNRDVEQVLSEARTKSLGYRRVPKQGCCYFDDLGVVMYVPENIVEIISIYKRNYYIHPN